MKSRQFPSFEAAIAYLEERGNLKFHGRAGVNYEYWVYTLSLHTGGFYRLKVYSDGKIEVME